MAVRPERRSRATAALVLSGLAALTASSALLAALSLGGWSGNPLSLASANERRAEVLAALAPPELQRVERASRDAINQAPQTASAWLRLAWVAQQKGDVAGRNAHLQRSYTVAFYSPEAAAWRLIFAHDHWPNLTPELRRQAHAELETALATRGAATREIELRITDPAGRLAFIMGVRAYDHRERLLARAAEDDRRSGATAEP